MNRLDEIVLYRGATSEVEFDFTNFEFGGGKVIFSLKNRTTGELIYQSEFTEKRKETVVFADKMTYKLEAGYTYGYDLMHHIEDRRYPQCLPSPVRVEKVVGGYCD